MWDVLSPVIADTLGIVITGLIAWAAAAVRQKYAIEIETSYRDSLHQALMSGVNAALARIGGAQGGIIPPSLKVEIVDQAIAYAKQSVPDAMKALKPSPEVMGHLAAAKLQLLTSPTSPQVVATTPQ